MYVFLLLMDMLTLSYLTTDEFFFFFFVFPFPPFAVDVLLIVMMGGGRWSRA